MTDFAQVFYYKAPEGIKDRRMQLIINSISKALGFIINMCVAHPMGKLPIIIEYKKPDREQFFDVLIAGTVVFPKELDYDLQPQSISSLIKTIKTILAPFAFFKYSSLLEKIISFFVMKSPLNRIIVKANKADLFNGVSNIKGGASFIATFKCDVKFLKALDDFVEKFAKKAIYDRIGKATYRIDLKDFRSRYSWQ